jgi:hypothetical protein
MHIRSIQYNDIYLIYRGLAPTAINAAPLRGVDAPELIWVPPIQRSAARGYDPQRILAHRAAISIENRLRPPPIPEGGVTHAVSGHRDFPAGF